MLTPAGERLAGEYPAAASLLDRQMAEGILARGSSRQYGYAARDLHHSASLAGSVADDGGIEGHDAFMARLQRERGERSRLWQRRQEERWQKDYSAHVIWSPALLSVGM